MKTQEYIIHTKFNEQKIIYEIKNVKHIAKNLLIKYKMFNDIKRDGNNELKFKPNFGPINNMLVTWEYTISFNNLDKGYINLKVDSKFNFLIFLFVIPMILFVGMIFGSIKKENLPDFFNYIIIFMLVIFTILFFIINFISIKSYKKKIINLLTTLLEGEIEYVK